MNRHATKLNQTIAAALLGLAACGSESPTAPDVEPPLAATAQERAALGLVLDDAMEWLVPAMADRAAADALRETFAQVAERLDAGRQPGFDQAVERAQAALDRVDGGRTSAPGGAELLGDAALVPDDPLVAVIRLTLRVVAAGAHGARGDGDPP